MNTKPKNKCQWCGSSNITIKVVKDYGREYRYTCCNDCGAFYRVLRNKVYWFTPGDPEKKKL